MSDPAHSTARGLSSLGTETHLESEIGISIEAELLPALTILWHPDLARVGQRALLTPLTSGRSVAVSRLEPDFAFPAGSHRPLPLAAARLSRTPFQFRPTPDGLVLDASGSRTRVEVDGVPMGDAGAEARRQIAASNLGQGVVVMLGGAIVLLLHEVDPSAAGGSRPHGMLGQSAGIAQVRRDVERVADLDVPVLVRGETGTGKELAAQAIHNAGPRADRAFVAVNMATLPATLAAAELFGARKGAFTGADQARDGLFRRAHGGTLFLDEVGETPHDVQPLLLRALETGEVRSVGSESTSRVDVRVVAATDLDLESAVGEQTFRAPLLHRLSGFVLRLPPLRNRLDDLGILLLAFLRRELEAVGEANRLVTGSRDDSPWLGAPMVARMALSAWPGNVRQLSNVARGLVIANRGTERADDLRALDELGPRRAEQTVSTTPTPTTLAPGTDPPPSQPGPRSGLARKPADIDEIELIAAMERSRYRPQAAADELGIPRASIYDLIDRSRSLRKATELDADEIREVLERCDAHVDSAAEELKVSAQALRRRMGKLGMTH